LPITEEKKQSVAALVSQLYPAAARV